MQHQKTFDIEAVIAHLRHYLPAQAPLKDFIHHNTLHSFQDMPFHDGLRHASAIFGYKVTLPLPEFRDLYQKGRIRPEILTQIIIAHKSESELSYWQEKMLREEYCITTQPRIGELRMEWNKHYRLNIDSAVQPLLFRIICSYLDQGISIWNFPIKEGGLIYGIREMERLSFSSFFKSQRVRLLLQNRALTIEDLLKILVEDESLYETYLYDQQFAHSGWSGMVAAIEKQPETLLDSKEITLYDFIFLELLMEIDALDTKLKGNWQPLGRILKKKPSLLFETVPSTELSDVMLLWQEAYEWSYYDEVLSGVLAPKPTLNSERTGSFQALFCIDDRECSIRRWVEFVDPNAETFGTAGFFGVEFYFKPEHGKFLTKSCPAPVTPQYIIKEEESEIQQKERMNMAHPQNLFLGWLTTHTIGLWSAVKLMLNIFIPTMSSFVSSSFRHMDRHSILTIEQGLDGETENGCNLGFTADEMAIRVENVLRSIGLIKEFSPIIYVIGHGASSINNPHYAAYDCGACSGRAGSVNARVFATMANHTKVRALLAEKGITIPNETIFLGGLHDTTRDEIIFYDEERLRVLGDMLHKKNIQTFEEALSFNAKERSRRFASINTKLPNKKIHKEIKKRALSIFEPRPELNHATNSLCIVGRRSISKHLFLDRRCFLNSYDYRTDPEGLYLLNILQAVAPVCGGINLEYYFSRVDNQKLGAGSKLPHNVVGLFGVANGADGDLRPGLPSQMIEVHEPVRLLVIVEHSPEVVLSTIQKNPVTYEWFKNEWIHLVALCPATQTLYRFKDAKFMQYTPLFGRIPIAGSILELIEQNQENIPIHLINTLPNHE